MTLLIYCGLFKSSGSGNVIRMRTLANYIVDKQPNTQIIFTGKKIEKIKELTEGKFEYLDYPILNLDREFKVALLDSTEDAIEAIAQNLKRHSNFLIAFDFFKYQSKNVDCIINLINHYPEKVSQFNGPLHKGTDFAIIQENILKAKKIKTDNKSILITFGGEDPMDYSFEAVELLSKYKIFKVSCILGNRYSGKLLTKAKEYNSINFIPFSNNISEHYANHSIIVCGGGTTIVEALFLGKHIFSKAQNFFENNFIVDLKKKFINVHNFTSLKKLVEEASFLSEVREIDGKGKKRILDIIESFN